MPVESLEPNNRLDPIIQTQINKAICQQDPLEVVNRHQPANSLQQPTGPVES